MSTKEKPQTIQKHHDEWQKDLNPAHMQGQDLGSQNVEDSNPRTAADSKELVRRLVAFDQDELKQIPLVPEGVRLEQGAVYLDLRQPGGEPIVASAEMIADAQHLYIPKSEVPYEYWNRLLDSEISRAAAAEKLIDDTLADSFPASDPPSWTTGRERDPTGNRS